MGHKGVSKRKPKKSKSPSNDNTSSFSNTRAGDNSPVSALVRDNSAPINKGGMNPSAGSNHKNKNGK